MAEKLKMDKVRRLLNNRYGEESQEAVLKLLGLVLEDFDPPKMTDTEKALAHKALKNLVDRAMVEPTVEEIEEA